MDCRNSAHDPLITENNSEASCSFTRRQSRENPLKRKRMDDLHEQPEPQPEETPEKRSKTEIDENNMNRHKSENDSEASCSFTRRDSKENSLKNKKIDVLHEEPELQPEEMPAKRRRTETEEKGTRPVRRINPFRMAKFYGRYSMIQLLGRGAYGHVYLGVRKSDGKKVALKLMPKFENESFITLPGDTRRLPLEVALLELVCKPPRCPYVIEMLEWLESPTLFILVLERPDPCIDLYKYCRVQCNKVSESQAQIIMQQVIQAARHCRDRGVFHRDIKEGNILLNPQTFEVKLIDFGCGALLTDAPYTIYAGTPRYIPPEWILIGEYDMEPATVWALGVLLRRLLRAEQPYFGAQQISNACRILIHWCLERDPQKRPSLEQMLAHPWFSGQCSKCGKEQI